MGRPRSTHCNKGHEKAGDNLLIATERRNGKVYTVHLCKHCTYTNHNEWRRGITQYPVSGIRENVSS
jgi:hypothetical protein